MEGIYLYVPRHTKITFVEEIDFLSGLGHSRARVRGGGTVYLISDLGEFDFSRGRMRLISLHPDVTVERIEAKTGFKLEIAEDLKTTIPPSPQELSLLREVIDPLGIRNLERLSGPKRNVAIRIILEKEMRQTT